MIISRKSFVNPDELVEEDHISFLIIFLGTSPRAFHVQNGWFKGTYSFSSA